MATIDFVVKNGLVVTEEAQILGTTDATSSSDTASAVYTAGGAAIAKKLFVGTDLTVGSATTLTGDLAVNGGDITTTATTFNLIDATATTVNFAGAGTTIDIGASTGTLTINNAQTVFNSTDSIKIPVGTVAQRDATPVTGQIRYNTELSTFEGYSSTSWGSLGGVKSVDGLTYIIAETSAGNSNDELEFYAAIDNTTTSKVGGWNQTRFLSNVNGEFTLDLAVNGGDLTTTASTFNLINANATTVNLAGAGTAITIGAVTGTTTIRNASTVVTGDLAVNGGDLTTTATTFNLLNATATTVNAFGAATTLELGAATGTTNVNNNLDVDGDVNIDGGDLTVSTATFNLANTTATTVNFAGAGTAVNIGASTGTTTINTPQLRIGGTDAGPNYISFRGTTGDGPGSYNHTYIGERIHTASECSELLLFKGNDPAAASGPDRVRVFAGEFRVDTYASAITGDTFETMGASASALNRLLITSDGNVTISQDLAVNGGDLTTTATTFNLINANATTVSFAGAATTLNIANTSTGTKTVNIGTASTGITTVNIGGAVDGNIIEVNSTAAGTMTLRTDVTTGTVNLFAGTTTGTTNIATGGAGTINVGGAASTLNIGTTGGNSIVEIRGNASSGNATLRTNSVTANVFDTNSTAVNFAGAGTAVRIGATTGTLTLRNPTVVGTETTVNLWNTTSTTVNAFGAATAINVGASTGTVTVGNPTLTMTNGVAFNMNGANPAIASTNTGTASIFNANITTVNFGQAADILMGGTAKRVEVRGNLEVDGNTTLGDASADTITANANTANVPNTLTFTRDDATANGITYPVIIRHTTSGTPANGIGVGLDFAVETTNNNNEIGARIEAVTTDVTATSEDFNLVFKTMVNGATATQSMLLNNATATFGASATATTINTQTSSNLTVTTGDVASTASGATVTVSGGRGGATSGAGGTAIFKGGDGQTSGAGGVATFKSGAAVGSNITGTDTIIEAGQGTGTQGAGNIIFKTGVGGASGTQQNPLSIVLTLTQAGLDVPGNIVVGGNLTVNGTTTTINSSTMSVDDKNLELGAVVNGIVSATGTVGSISGSGPWTATITGMTTTAGLIPGSTITATISSGSIGAGGTYTITAINSNTSVTYTATGGTTPVAGAVTNINTTGPTNVTADGGGITLKGATDKTINWINSAAAWTSSEDWNLVSGKQYEINTVGVLTATAVLANQATASIGHLTSAATVSIGGASANNILQINGSGTGGTATLTTNVTTGIVNAFASVTGTVNYAGNAATTTVANTITTAQTVSIGGGSTAASTYNFGHGTTSSGVTKTLNIGSGGASGSITNVNIGSSTAGATGTSTVNGSAVNLATNHNAAVTVTAGPAITNNTFKIASITGGTINLTTDITTGTVNLYTSVGTGTINAFTGVTTGTTNIATGGASTTNIGGNGSTLNIGNTGGNSILNIRGNGTAGIATIGTNVTTGTINFFTGITSGTVNIATGGNSTTNIGGNAAALNLGTISGNSTLTIRGNGAGGTATIATNVTTGIFDVARGLTSGTVNIGSANVGRVAILFNQASTSTTTGALTVAGGVGISGALNATTKSFIIKHPTKKGMLLKHGSLEGPEFGVYTRGRLTGGSVITLPEYWNGLVDKKTITVDLTACSKHQRLYVEKIKGLEIHIGNEGSADVDCFYTVWAERKDVDKLEVEAVE
jgi:hypothetical protein